MRLHFLRRGQAVLFITVLLESRLRDARGVFATRAALRQVPRFGEKTFEQAAGFLRIQNGENPLDASAVHPESYPVVESSIWHIR
jgi:uncharacterized protein